MVTSHVNQHVTSQWNQHCDLSKQSHHVPPHCSVWVFLQRDETASLDFLPGGFYCLQVLVCTLTHLLPEGFSSVSSLPPHWPFQLIVLCFYSEGGFHFLGNSFFILGQTHFLCGTAHDDSLSCSSGCWEESASAVTQHFVNINMTQIFCPHASLFLLLSMFSPCLTNRHFYIHPVCHW